MTDEEEFLEWCKKIDEEESPIIINGEPTFSKKDQTDFLKMSCQDLINFADAWTKTGFPKHAIKILKLKKEIPKEYQLWYCEILLSAYIRTIQTPIKSLKKYDAVFDCLLNLESMNPDHKLIKKHKNILKEIREDRNRI